MNHSSFPVVFRRQLRFWTFHCFFNALPSLVIALGFLRLWKSPGAVAAMTAAIVTFILLYAAVTSLRGPLSEEEHVLSRALKLGTKIRGWISGISVLLILSGKGILLAPDIWCGMLAINLLNRAASFAGVNNSGVFQPEPAQDIEGFLRIYTTTMTQGFILSFLLLMISFFSILFLQARDRKKFLALTDSR
jgi:hypothetical protein